MQFDGTSNVYVHIQAQLCVSAVIKQVQNCTHDSCSCEVKTYPEPHDMVHVVTPCSADGCSGYNAHVLSNAKMRQDIDKKLGSNDILKENNMSKMDDIMTYKISNKSETIWLFKFAFCNSLTLRVATPTFERLGKALEATLTNQIGVNFVENLGTSISPTDTL